MRASAQGGPTSAYDTRDGSIAIPGGVHHSLPGAGVTFGSAVGRCVTLGGRGTTHLRAEWVACASDGAP
jgi:hypothetical protein